jgi:hypothetical protein
MSGIENRMNGIQTRRAVLQIDYKMGTVLASGWRFMAGLAIALTAGFVGWLNL